MKTGFYFLLIGVFAGLILIFPPIKKPKKPVSHAQKGISLPQKGFRHRCTGKGELLTNL
jgi:hypothetical protein